MGSADEIMQMCRLCLVKDQVNIPIFDEPTDIKQTFLKISSCLPVKVSREDNLPKKICDDCSYKLDVAYQFRNTSSSSEKQLIQLLEQFGIPAQTAISGKSEISVKLENVITEDGNICPDTQNYILQQQKLPYQQSFAEFGEASSSDAPPRKRAKRASATSKKSATATSVQEILTDPLVDSSPAATITKAEEDSNDSDDMVLSTFASASATSANDQAGPSGVGKGNIDAPCVITVEPSSALTFLKKHKFECPLCPKELLTSTERDLHIKSAHESMGKSKTCRICSKTLSTYRRLKLHFKTHLKLERFTCPVCNSGFNRMAHLDRHISNEHEGFRFSCEPCRKQFKYVSLYLQHVKIHEPDYVEKAYTCKICCNAFKNRKALSRHKVVHDPNPKRYICNVCGKELRTAQSLKHHTEIHLGDKKYVCEFCAKAFVRRENLIEHWRIHTKERPYMCHKCHKTYTQRSSLNTHLRAAHFD